MNQEFSKFIKQERESRDTIDFKKIYVDMAGGDPLVGLVLSEIIYWYLPSKNTANKLRVKQNGYEWIACRRHEWWDRTRMTPRQSDRALDILEAKGLAIIGVFKFNGDPTKHVRLNTDVFMEQWNYFTDNPAENPFLPVRKLRESNNEITHKEGPVTETTTKTTNTIPSNAGDEEIKDSIDQIEPKGGKAVRKVQPHMAPIIAWADTVGEEYRSKTFKWSKYSGYSKELYLNNVAPEYVTCAALLYKAWLTSLKGKPSLTWSVGEVRTAIEHAINMCEKHITPEDVQKFVREKRNDKFWNGKLIPFDYVANNIDSWKSQEPDSNFEATKPTTVIDEIKARYKRNENGELILKTREDFDNE